MELNEYQKRAMTTCMVSCDNFSYMMLNLVGEVGEFASKVAKHIRKKKMYIGDGYQPNELFYNFKAVEESTMVDWNDELKKEAGDILWQLAGLCHVQGWDLEEVAKMNLEKLASRKQRNVIDGDGDNR